MNNFALLEESSPFFPLFRNGLVPIKNILLPTQAECIGDGIQDVYDVDTKKLTPEQLEKILDLITAACPELRDQARHDIATIGLPLRAKHVRGTSTDCPFFL